LDIGFEQRAQGLHIVPQVRQMNLRYGCTVQAGWAGCLNVCGIGNDFFLYSRRLRPVADVRP